jgi:hypothetical protein
MDVTTISSAAMALSQQAAQSRLGMAAIKNAAEAQNQLAAMLAQTAEELPLLTSGSIGTNINTTA